MFWRARGDSNPGSQANFVETPKAFTTPLRPLCLNPSSTTGPSSCRLDFAFECCCYIIFFHLSLSVVLSRYRPSSVNSKYSANEIHLVTPGRKPEIIVANGVPGSGASRSRSLGVPFRDSRLVQCASAKIWHGSNKAFIKAHQDWSLNPELYPPH